MKIIRSWPEKVPPNRNYVVDTLPRFFMQDYSYRGIGEFDDDVLILEWDMAVSQEDLGTFLAWIEKTPDKVVVAPYKIYQATSSPAKLWRPIYAMRRYNDGEATMRYVTEDDATCHLWALGMTYLPRDVIRAFLDAWPGHFSDTSLSGWHYRNVEKETTIAWNVRPVHLHYAIEEMGR